MVGLEKTNDMPVFVPPRKRQTSKKSGGVQLYVDHIVNIQVQKTKQSNFLNQFVYSGIH